MSKATPESVAKRILAAHIGKLWPSLDDVDQAARGLTGAGSGQIEGADCLRATVKLADTYKRRLLNSADADES